MSKDPSVYDGTETLINHFAITDPIALRQPETDLTLITVPTWRAGTSSVAAHPRLLGAKPLPSRGPAE